MRAFCPDQRTSKGQQVPEAAQTIVPPVVEPEDVTIVEESEEAPPRKVQPVALRRTLCAPATDLAWAVVPEAKEANDTCSSSSTLSVHEDEEPMEAGDG